MRNGLVKLWDFLNKERLKEFCDRFCGASFNLLQENFKMEIGVLVEPDDAIRVYAPRYSTKEEAKRICFYLLQAANIIAVGAGLQMTVASKAEK